MTAQNNAQPNLTGLSRTGLELFSPAILHGFSTYQTRLKGTELFKLNSFWSRSQRTLVNLPVGLGEKEVDSREFPVSFFPIALPVSLCHPHNSLVLRSRRAALQSRQRLLPSQVPLICWLLKRQKKGREIFFSFEILLSAKEATHARNYRSFSFICRKSPDVHFDFLAIPAKQNTFI